MQASPQLDRTRKDSVAPLLTIAIPTVNRLELFKRALASALAQTVPVEVIVSDNGSTDGTDSYLNSVELPPHVRRFRYAPTMLVQRHGAFLVSQVRTEWVVFLSDDDYLEPEFAARILGLIEERPDVALAYTGCNLYFGDVAVPAIVGPRFESSIEFFFEFMDGKRNICLCATAFRTCDLQKIGPQPDSILIGDMYYWTRILSTGGVVACDPGHLSNYYCYRPGISTEVNRTPVLTWAGESEQLASIMCKAILEAPQSSHSRAEVGRVRAKFLALTTSNQFAWNALRGASKLELTKSFFRLAKTVFGNMAAPARVLSALLLPRSSLEKGILKHARKLAALEKQRQSQER